MSAIETPNPEAAMDFHSLVAANLTRTSRPTRMDAAAEQRYYRDHGAGPRLRLGSLVPIATVVGLILLVTYIAPA
jgi:hypothetical protein